LDAVTLSLYAIIMQVHAPVFFAWEEAGGDSRAATLSAGENPGVPSSSERPADPVDDMADAIQLRILTGEYGFGTPLRQAQLAEEFGVSRTPVREALRKLQAAGLVEIVRHRGAVVRGPSARDLREAYVVRAELEGLAAELAARWVTDAELEQLVHATELFRNAVEAFSEGGAAKGAGRMARAKDWVRANDMLHGLIQTASRNVQLQRSISDILDRCLRPGDASWSALSHDSHLLRTNVGHHEEILHALERHDGAEARRLMTAHIRHSGEHVATWFEEQARVAAAREDGSRGA
jgi:DNA-binding GntR family transcriptional regulator